MRKAYLLLLLTLLFSVSCGKQTPGPEGPEGPQGSEGIAGQDGATIRSGMSAPTLTHGNVGDFFLDLSSGMLYGPKTAAGWGEPISLKGEQGPTGSEGASFIGGEGAPTESTGKPGDYYFDKVNLAIFGPKTGSGWGSPVSLKSPEQAGVRTLIKENTKFENLVKEPDYVDFDGTVIPANVFNSEITLEIERFEDYARYGLVVVYIKPAGDSLWDEYGTNLADSVKWHWVHILLEGYTEFGIHFDGPKITHSGIVLRASISEWYRMGPDYIDFNTTAYRQLLSDSFAFDIKIVLIPASSVEYLSTLKPQGLDQHSVERFLRIN